MLNKEKLKKSKLYPVYKLLKKIYNFLFGFFYPKYKKSYSQSGEDLIIHQLIKNFSKKELLYIDVGAFNPFRLSNTALFYKMGWRGINIEPNPDKIGLFFKKRKRDINLNIGISSAKGELDYYKMSSSTLNTFSKESADENVKNHNIKLKEVIKIKVDTIKNVVDRYSNGKFPPFLSLDTEGTEMDVLKTIDFDNNYPKIICVETREFGRKIKEDDGKNFELINFIKSKNYFIFADTGLNTVFVRNNF